MDAAIAPQVNRIIAQLRETGIARVDDFWTAEHAQEWGQRLSKFGAVKTGDDSIIQVRKGSTRWNEVEKDFPDLMTDFGNHPIVSAVSLLYQGTDRVNRLSFQESFPDPKVDKMLSTGQSALDLRMVGLGRSWHVDTWAYGLKAFVLLVDVGEENGPYHYIPGSHRDQFSKLSWIRLRKSWPLLPPDPFDDNSTLYLDAKQAAAADRRSDLVKGVGPAGTLYLTDTRGFHRAGALRSGMRRVLWNYLLY